MKVNKLRVNSCLLALVRYILVNTGTPNLSFPILLASSSVYRAALLSKLGLNFTQAAPSINETRLANETPHNMVSRLAQQKALALCEHFPNHIIIASDQIAITKDGKVLGKPHCHERAVEQLTQVSGEKVSFLTSLCVLSPAVNYHLDNEKHSDNQTDDPAINKWREQLIVEPYHVYFRALTHKQICHYVTLEKPFDCAGSFKAEGLGISLFSKLEGDDPNALIGLPLIQLCTMLSAINSPVLN